MATTFLSCSVLMMNFPLLLALHQTKDQIRFGTFSLHLSVILGFFSCSFSSSQTCQHICPCPNNTAGEDSFMFFFWHQNTINPYALQTGTHLLELHLSVCVYVCVWVCVCVCLPLAFLSDHRECDKWMCQSLMEHCDCSARHKAITRLYRQPQRKILFQSTTHNLGDKERCPAVHGKSRSLVLKEDPYFFFFLLQYVSIVKKLNTEIVI